MTSKNKGTIVEMLTALFFLLKECTVSIPLGDNARYDLIVDINNKLYRVQCKHGRLENGCVTADACTYSKFTGTTNYEGDIDMFAIYASFMLKLYLVPMSDNPPKGKIVLRVEPPKKNYTKKLWKAEDYEADKTFEKLINIENQETPSQCY